MSAQDFSELQFKSADVDARTVAASLRPWPRYFARMIDILVVSTPLFFVLVVAGMLVAPAGTSRFVGLVNTGWGGRLLAGPIAALLSVLPIALLLALGQTPGKWLFGIRVHQADGRRLGWRKALHREALVVTEGLALAIPLLTCFTLYRGMSRLNDTGTTPWDARLGCQVSHGPSTAWWWTKAWFGGLLWFAITFYDRLLAAVG